MKYFAFAATARMQLPLLFCAATLFCSFQGPSPSISVFTSGVQAWAPNPFSSFLPHRTQRTIPRCDDANGASLSDGPSRCSSVPAKGAAAALETRRCFLTAAAVNACIIGTAATSHSSLADAADEATTPATRYISGKPPQVAGQAKPQDKSNVKGTRKDPDFLRSIADCRSQCQNTVGSDGYARAKEDCLSECQDICCKTYEQCTFNIVPRL